MASHWYPHALYLMASQQLDLTGTYKVVLVGTANGGYVYDPQHRFCDPGISGPTSVAANELVASGYGRGYGGAGRRTAAQVLAEDTTNARLVVSLPNITWASLGGAQNDVVTGAVLIREGASDADSVLVAYWELPATPLSGRNFSLLFSGAAGNLRLLA